MYMRSEVPFSQCPAIRLCGNAPQGQFRCSAGGRNSWPGNDFHTPEFLDVLATSNSKNSVRPWHGRRSGGSFARHCLTACKMLFPPSPLVIHHSSFIIVKQRLPNGATTWTNVPNPPANFKPKNRATRGWPLLLTTAGPSPEDPREKGCPRSFTEAVPNWGVGVTLGHCFSEAVARAQSRAPGE